MGVEEQIGELAAGDRVESAGRRVGAGRRTGSVVEVLGEPGRRRCRVRWDDGHETLLYPGTDVRALPPLEEEERIQ